MAQRLVVIAEIRCLFLRLLETQRTRANGYAVAILKRMLEFLFPIDVDLIGASV